MERASRVQLQQYTNGAQPSVTGGVESRPAAHGPGRPRAVGGAPGSKRPPPGPTRPAPSAGPSKELRSEPESTESRIKEKRSTKHPRMESTQSLNIGTTPKSSVRLKTGSVQLKKTGSQQSVGPRIRFQIDTNERDDRRTVQWLVTHYYDVTF